MASVMPQASRLPYSRRVSFNNLHPDDEPSQSKFYSYSMNSEPTPHADLDVLKMFGNYTLGALTGRKRLKLPDPPSKLILKNKLTASQLQHNVQHAELLGVSYHGDINDMVNHPPDNVPRSELAQVIGGDKSDSDSDSDTEDEEEAPQAPSARRKLYSAMTDEELMALDPQFAKPKTSNLDNFKFDSTTTYYSPARRGSSSASTATPVAKQIIYPSSNENNYELISLTIKHQDYDNENVFARTLLTVISGRKHTWNSLDWLFDDGLEGHKHESFLQDGDYLVVAALVPLKFFEECKSSSRKKISPESRLYTKCDGILQYLLQNLPNSLRLKITVELVMDIPPPDPMATKKTPSGTKFMLSHLFKQYLPCLVVLGNRSTNLNFKYPLRMNRRSSVATGMKAEKEHDQYLVKLSSYLVKYASTPLIFVGNATIYHHEPLAKPLGLVTFSDTKPPRGLLDAPPSTGRKDSAASVCSIESYSGAHNDLSSLSLVDLSHLKAKVEEMLTLSSEDRFADMLVAISLSSLAQLKQYLDIIKDDSIDKISPDVLNSKVHRAYQQSAPRSGGSMLLTTLSNGTSKPYKVKSLVSYSEDEEKKNEKMLNEKKLRKTASRTSAVSTGLGGPSDEKKSVKKKKSFLQKLGVKK